MLELYQGAMLADSKREFSGGAVLQRRATRSSNNCDLSVTSGGFIHAVLLKVLVALEGIG